jgi:hypothetical protein
VTLPFELVSALWTAVDDSPFSSDLEGGIVMERSRKKCGNLGGEKKVRIAVVVGFVGLLGL